MSLNSTSGLLFNEEWCWVENGVESGVESGVGFVSGCLNLLQKTDRFHSICLVGRNDLRTVCLLALIRQI